MNPQIKTVLLTVLTLSVLTIAMIELSGVSTKAFINKNQGSHKHETDHTSHLDDEEEKERLKEIRKRDSLMRSMPKTSMKFETSEIDFGKLKEGEKVRHVFTFENTGEEPLFISDVHSPCGCTVPTFSKNVILPGKSGEITIEFDSKNRRGLNKKTLMVFANIEETKMPITFKAEVE